MGTETQIGRIANEKNSREEEALLLQDGLDCSFEVIDDQETFLHNSNFLFSDQLFWSGEVNENGNLVVKVTTKDRIGVVKLLTQCCCEHGGNIIGCTSQRLTPFIRHAPKSEGGETDPRLLKILRFQTLNLYQSVFLITGNIASLRHVWKKISLIRDLESDFRDRTGPYDHIRLLASGPDRAGVLYQICETLFDLDVNISYLFSEADLDLEASRATVRLTLEIPKNRTWKELTHLGSLLNKRELLTDWKFTPTDLNNGGLALLKELT